MKRSVAASTTSRYAAGAADGDPKAMEALIGRIEARLKRFCLYLTGNRERAEDLCQEAYVRILENIHKLDDTSKFVSWMFQVTRNLFIDHVRSPKNRDYSDLDNVKLETKATSAIGVQLSRKLASLDPESRMLLLLVCLEGHSYAEAADVLGSTEEAVRCKLYRVRKDFRPEDFTVSGKI